MRIDQRGYRTTFTLDALNRVYQVRDALGGYATTVFDSAGNVQASVDQLGRRTTYTLDALNRVSQVQDALSGYATTVADAEAPNANTPGPTINHPISRAIKRNIEMQHTLPNHQSRYNLSRAKNSNSHYGSFRSAPGEGTRP